MGVCCILHISYWVRGFLFQVRGMLGFLFQVRFLFQGYVWEIQQHWAGLPIGIGSVRFSGQYLSQSPS